MSKKKKIFSKSQEAIWSQIVERFDADVIKGKGLKSTRIEAFHGEWMILFETVENDEMGISTRVRAPYLNKDKFRFKIYHDQYAKFSIYRVGLQDVEVGYPEFDKDFIIQGNNKDKLKVMFANPHIRKLLSFQPPSVLEIRNKPGAFEKYKFPKGMSEVYYEIKYAIKDIDQLHDLYDLFSHTLDHLCHIGSAYEEDPKFCYHSKRKLFKTSKKEIWSQISQRIQGNYVKGSLLKRDRIEAHFGEWTIVFDTYIKENVAYTRVRAPYVNQDNFQFTIFREKKIHKGLKVFGMQDIETGYTEFDKHFVIQGNNSTKVRQLFSNPHIRELLSFQSKPVLKINPENTVDFQKAFPPNVNEVYFEVKGVIEDLDQLHDLYDLFSFTLEHLCHIGSAYEDDPDFLYF